MVIDVDDTLCLTEAVTFELENEALARLGRAPMSRSVHQDTWGMPLLEGIVRRSPGVDLAAFGRVYQPLLEERVQSGVLDAVTSENLRALDDLIDRGYRLMLLTSRTHAELKHMLEPDHDLANRITAFYYAERTGHLKPDPRVFEVMLAEHELTPSECVYVGDSPSDAAAANGSGLHFIACLASRLRTRADFAQHEVAAFVEEFDELPSAVEEFARP